MTTLFDLYNPAPAEEPLLPRDSHVVEAPEVVRLSRQNAAVLARLQRGPATRSELQAIAPNITARISDLRTAGYDIPRPVENKVTGLSIYRLVPE